MILCLTVWMLPLKSSAKETSLEYLSSSLWTGIQDVLVEGGYAYCAFVNGLEIINISEPTSPVREARICLSGGTHHVFKLDSLLYIAGESGLTIIDVSVPAAPNIVGSLNIYDGITDLVAIGGLVCAITSNDSADFFIIDVSDPTHPDSVGYFYSPGGTPWDLAVTNGYVYLADDLDGLSIVDIGDPANPQLIDSLNIPGISTGIVLDDTLAYIVGDSFWVVNINLSPPEIIGSHPFDIIAGSDCISLDIFIRDSLVYVTYMEYFVKFNANLEIMNVIDPTHPVRVGNPPVDPTGFFPIDDLAYLIYGFPFSIENVDRSKGLQIYNIYDLTCLPPYCPESLIPVGDYEVPFRILDVHVDGDYAYVAADSSGLYILDISDPANPDVTGRFDDLLGSVRAVFAVERVVYITYHYSGDYLVTLNVSDPANPIFLDSIVTPGSAYDVFVADTVAYIADGNPDLTTVNVARPSDLSILDYIYVPGLGYGVFVDDNLACLADYFNGLAIFNVEDPANLSFVSNSQVAWEARDIYVQGDFAYLTQSTYGIRVVDISNPAAPVMRGGYATPGTNLGVHVLGERAYVTDERMGLYIIDVADADSLFLIDSYDTPGNAGAVFADDGIVYVADYFSLMIFRDTGFPQPTLCGNANGDDKVNVGDAVYLINYIFRDGAAPIPAVCHGDANADGLTNVGDAVYIINYIFRDGAAPGEGCCSR